MLDYIHPPIEELLPPAGIEPTPFQNLVSKVARLQVHATKPSLTCLVCIILKQIGNSPIENLDQLNNLNIGFVPVLLL